VKMDKPGLGDVTNNVVMFKRKHLRVLADKPTDTAQPVFEVGDKIEYRCCNLKRWLPGIIIALPGEKHGGDIDQYGIKDSGQHPRHPGDGDFYREEQNIRKISDDTAEPVLQYGDRVLLITHTPPIPGIFVGHEEGPQDSGNGYFLFRPDDWEAADFSNGVRDQGFARMWKKDLKFEPEEAQKEADNMAKPVYKVGDRVRTAHNSTICAPYQDQVGTITELPTKDRDQYAVEMDKDLDHDGVHIFYWTSKQIRLEKADDPAKPVLQFSVGDHVETLYHGEWVPATIAKIDPEDIVYNCPYRVLYNGNQMWRMAQNVRAVQPKESNDTAKPEGINTMTENKNLLIPDPCKQGEHVLLGTGHRFDKTVLMPVCFDEDYKIIGFGQGFHDNEVWDTVEWFHLPDNIENQISGMNSSTLKTIQKRVYEALPPKAECCKGKFFGKTCGYRVAPNKTMCGRHVKQAREKQEENAPRRRRRRRCLLALVIAAVVGYAAIDMDTFKPRTWAKDVIQTIGHALKDVGSK